MLGKSHAVFGLGSYLLAGVTVLQQDYSFVEWVIFTPLALIGSLFPDLDHHNSRIKRNFFIKLASIPLTLFGHRTWSHSILIMLAMTSLYFFVPEALLLGLVAFLIGYASHIIGDWMTPNGVPLFWPLKTKFRSPLNFRTGSWIEYPFALIPLGAFGLIFYSNIDTFLS